VALYSVRLRVEYTVNIEVESDAASDAMQRAALDAADRVEHAFLSDGGSLAVGESRALEAVCLTEFA